MLKKRYMVVGILAFCLTTTLFIGIATSGKKEDPLWTTISELQADVDSLNATIAEQEARISELESQPTTGFLSRPAYDSGWTSIAKDQEIIFYHNLNTTEVLVYIIGCAGGEWADYGIHQIEYGGAWYGDVGAGWCQINNTAIHVIRGHNDNVWHSVRVMIWKIQLLPW